MNLEIVHTDQQVRETKRWILVCRLCLCTFDFKGPVCSSSSWNRNLSKEHAQHSTFSRLFTASRKVFHFVYFLKLMPLFVSVCLEGRTSFQGVATMTTERSIKEPVSRSACFSVEFRNSALLFLEPENEVMNFSHSQHRLSDKTETHHSILLSWHSSINTYDTNLCCF